jgi:hypothetical protein
MRVITVLQTRALHALHPGSSEFKPAHVQALARQIERHAPFADFHVLSDVRVPGVETIPLTEKWPGWWAKMAMFDPAIRGDFLYVDLDTVIVGPLDDFKNVMHLTLLRDFYRDGKKLKEGLGSGLMFLPEAARAAVWADFSANPALSMRLYAGGGDQRLLEAHYLNKAARWQDVLPGQVVSWKVHCKSGVPPGARIVCGHGKPRPWEVGEFLHLYR